MNWNTSQNVILESNPSRFEPLKMGGSLPFPQFPQPKEKIMLSLKYESFHSRRYEVVVNRLYGVHLVRHRPTNQTTLLATCSEGYEEYQQLKAAWRKSRRRFERLCSEYTYHL